MLALISVVSLILAGTEGDQQRRPEPTLLELAREHGGIDSATMGCGPSVPLDDIVRKADVIVYGTVIGVEARLSGDQRQVLTDYHIHTFTMLRMNSSMKQEPQQTPVFTARGGSVVVDGLNISQSVQHNSRRVALNVGDEVIVMGTVEKQMLMLSPVGVFNVSDGGVKANGTVKGLTNEGPGVPLDQFMARVLTLSTHN